MTAARYYNHIAIIQARVQSVTMLLPTCLVREGAYLCVRGSGAESRLQVFDVVPSRLEYDLDAQFQVS
jgi:hypothetical protein